MFPLDATLDRAGDTRKKSRHKSSQRILLYFYYFSRLDRIPISSLTSVETFCQCILPVVIPKYQAKSIMKNRWRGSALRLNLQAAFS